MSGSSQSLNGLTSDVLDHIKQFLQSATEDDRLVLMFATVEALLSDSEKRALEDLRILGRSRFGTRFDVETISVHSIYRNGQESEETQDSIKIPLLGTLTTAGESNLIAGAIPLRSLYIFLQKYKNETGDLDSLYEKNVRRYLTLRKPINKKMRDTLRETPELFGLYNNGVTIVVKDFEVDKEGYILHDPYVVNGCQTTRTIYDTLHSFYENGGSGEPANVEWYTKASRGVVIIKIVRVGTEASGDVLLRNITRYTNSQNAINDKDLMALESILRDWAKEMDTAFDVFLETQKGGWESRTALQKKRPALKQFASNKYANVADLLKVYGAGWLSEPGTAWQQNKAFLPPNGMVWKKIIDKTNTGLFSTGDLYAAFLLQQKAQEYQFGRGAKEQTRKLTRFLFYFVTLELFRHYAGSHDPNTITGIFLALSQHHLPVRDILTTTAVNIIDEYMGNGDNSVRHEKQYKDNINLYLKGSELGNKEYSEKLYQLIANHRAGLNYAQLDGSKATDVIKKAFADASTD